MPPRIIAARLVTLVGRAEAGNLLLPSFARVQMLSADERRQSSDMFYIPDEAGPRKFFVLVRWHV